MLVHTQAGQLLRQDGFEREPGRDGALLDHTPGRVNRRREIDLGLVELELSRLSARKVEHLVDHRQEMFRARQDIIRVLDVASSADAAEQLRAHHL